MTFLVTGGAGYIGSHVVHALAARGDSVIVYDDLSNGHKEHLPDAVGFVQGDVGDRATLASVFSSHKIDAVLHFAGLIQVGESMEYPAKYYDVNYSKPLALLQVMGDFNCDQIVFSSTAAVYGDAADHPLTEADPLNPTSPYGDSKLQFEQVLSGLSAFDLRSVSLRYFNASGAGFGVGEAHDPETHLIPLILQVALGERADIKIFGDDYPTGDGTCVRDYIHVLDLADAHLRALDYLQDGGTSGIFNLGSGDGYSVREIISVCRDVTGHAIPAEVVARRAGDPAVLIASSAKAKEVLDWQPQRDLRSIVESAWAWHNR